MKKQTALLLLLLSMGMIAQERALKKADKTFENESYISAMKIYENLANKGMGSEQIYEKLGDANYFNANYLKAEQWYSKRYELKGSFSKEFLYRYAQSLKSAGKDQESQEILARYARENPTQLRAKNQNQQLVQQSVQKGTDLFTIDNLNINSKFSDYSSTIKGDTLIFSSARPRTVGNQIYARTGQSYTNLYYSVKQPDGNFTKPDLYSKSSFSIFHEASPVFTPDGNGMYYTQNQVKEKHQKKLVNGLYKIYKSVRQNGKWKNLGVQDIFAKDTARVAHPALSPDGKTLYFASDAKGSFGQSDLFKVTINDDGTYATPQNLGNTVNTEGRESYPFVTHDNLLVFASDGHPGKGGFDVFVLDLNKEGALPVHLNAPLNSPFDDFGLNWNRNTHAGVFTSNRPNGKGDDDLYLFKNDAEKPFAFDYTTKIIGKVLDKNTRNPIPKATVILFDANAKEIARSTTNETGNFAFEQLPSNETYRIQANKEKYTPNESSSTVSLYEKEVSTEIAVDQDQYEIDNGLDLAKALALRQIYFDLNKWDIRKDATVELEKIVEVLRQHPTIKIAIGSHTDSRQSQSYNLELSQKRAQATLNYLVQQGIDAKRLTAKGYGESQLVNSCDDNTTCTEEEHQLNRRSSFIIQEN